MNCPTFKVVLARPIKGEQRCQGEFDLGMVSVGKISNSTQLIKDLSLMAEMLPQTPIIVVSENDDAPLVTAAVQYGVRGFFSTNTRLCVLVQGIRLVLLGGTALPATGRGEADPRLIESAHALVPADEPWLPARAGLFTPRELDVLRCLGAGRPNKLIAHELRMCETTVKVHLRHIFHKLGTTNRTHAALLAREMLEDPGR
jgi:DNA-binding NarL/FixJ family response regulator